MCDQPQHGDWCNCQAIEGTKNFPGPWHPRDENCGPLVEF